MGCHTALVGVAGARNIDISLSSLSLGKKTDLLVFHNQAQIPFPSNIYEFASRPRAMRPSPSHAPSYPL